MPLTPRTSKLSRPHPSGLRSVRGEAIATWSREAEEQIVKETFLPGGANVSVIARSQGLDPSQLFAWLRGDARHWPRDWSHRFSGARGQTVKFARLDAVTSHMVEILIGDVVVRVGGDGEPERLAAVIRAVRAHGVREELLLQMRPRHSMPLREIMPAAAIPPSTFRICPVM